MMIQRAMRLGQAAGQGVGVKAMSDQELVAAIATAPKAVAIFYSPGCPYSRKFLPIYEALAPQDPGILFASVNVDEHVQQAGVNKVQMLPTVVFFLNGKAVGRIDGVQDQGDFLAEMNKAFAATPAAAAAAAGPASAPSQRSGTLVDTQAPVAPLVLGGVVAAGILAVGAYLIFGK